MKKYIVTVQYQREEEIEVEADCAATAEIIALRQGIRNAGEELYTEVTYVERVE